MVAQVVVDKALDEVVAVVVAWLAAQLQRLADAGAGGFKGFGKELLFDEKFVRQALVDQDAAGVRRSGLRRHQRAGIVVEPLRLVAS